MGTGGGTTSQEDLRRANASALLRRVHTHGPTSRAQLTYELGLNRSTIGDLTGQLESAGLVIEQAPASDEPRARRSGRPSLVVVPRADVVVLAVALDVDRIIAALVSLGGEELSRRTRLHQRGGHEVGQVVDAIAQLCQELLGEHPTARCLGAGVSVPGAVRSSDGLVRFGPNLGWADAPFTALLAERLGLPVRTENDANLGMLAEQVRGAASGVQEAAYISGSVGIGGGFLVGGNLLRGADGYAGEIGHLPVITDGLPCRCGSAGCWETTVGENVLLTGAGRLPGGGPDAVVEVIEAAESGDRRARESLDDVAQWTGRGLRAVVNLFNPEVIILGGVLRLVLSAREAMVREALAAATLIPEGVRLSAPFHGNDSPLVGAAELAFQPVIDDPLQGLRETDAAS